MSTESILSFLADNYKYFMIAAGVLLVALIGFYFDGKKKKKAAAESTQPIPQGGFTQDANMQIVQNTVEPVAPVQSEVPVEGPALSGEPAVTAPANDTIFTAPPVNSNENVEEKLIIEEPQTALNNNAGIDAMMNEAPAMTAEVQPQVPVSPIIEMNTAPAETIIEAPVSPSPQMASPISMEPEAPVMQSAEPQMVAPQPTQTVQPTQTYQNTIQQ